MEASNGELKGENKHNLLDGWRSGCALAHKMCKNLFESRSALVVGHRSVPTVSRGAQKTAEGNGSEAKVSTKVQISDSRFRFSLFPRASFALIYLFICPTCCKYYDDVEWNGVTRHDIAFQTERRTASRQKSALGTENLSPKSGERARERDEAHTVKVHLNKMQMPLERSFQFVFQLLVISMLEIIQIIYIEMEVQTGRMTIELCIAAKCRQKRINNKSEDCKEANEMQSLFIPF